MVNSETLLITIEYVRQALDALIRVGREEFSPLYYLQIVEDYMLLGDFTFFEQPHRIALNEILTSYISDLYSRRRLIYDLPARRMPERYSDISQTIASDAASHKADLIGLSWLNHHYVEIYARLSQQEFSDLTGLDARTIRRYQRNAIDELTSHLIKQEQLARKVRRTKRLYVHLPNQGKRVSLFGRDKELITIKKCKSRNLHIMGGVGIGKTVFVEYLIKEQIDNDQVDDIVWLDSPPNLKYARNALHERFHLTKSNIKLSEYVSLKRVSIVFDNADDLLRDSEEFKLFLQELSNTNCYFITKISRLPILGFQPIVLQELSLAAVEQIRFEIVPNNGENQTVESPIEIMNLVGGNPLAISLFLRHRLLYSTRVANLFTLEQLYSDLVALLPSSTLLAWLLISLNFNNQLVLTQLQDVDLPFITFHDFIVLTQHHIVEDESGGIRISVSARHFIKHHYLTSVALQQLFSSFLDELTELYILPTDTHIVLIESILTIDWLVVDKPIKRQIADRLWKTGVHKGHYAQWYLILSEHIDELSARNLNLLLGYSVCLRFLGEWNESQALLESIIEYCGLQDLFYNQCEGLLELCVILRYKGNYEEAATIVEHIKKLSPILKSSQIDERGLLEEIELAMDKNDWVSARHLLTKLSKNHPRKPILELELSIVDIQDNFGDLLKKAQIAYHFNRLSGNPSMLAKAHVLIGRLYEKQQRSKLAIKHFVASLTLLDGNDNDPFALARTQSNLAAAFLNSNQLTGASELIEASERIQRILGDKVGLAVTMHNSAVLKRKLVG